MEPKEISDLTFEFIVDISIGDTHCLALSKGLFVCLFVCLLIRLLVCLLVYLFTYLFTCLFTYLFTRTHCLRLGQ